MAELLSIYQDNLVIIYNKISKLLNMLTNPNIDKFDLRAKDIEINLREAERMLKQMDLEITTNNNIASSDKNAIKKNYILNKTKYDNFKKIFFKEKEKYSYSKKKEEMILKEKIELELEKSKSNSEIEKIIENNNYIENSNYTLQNVKMNAVQMDSISKNIIIDLEKQNHQLQNSHLRMQDLNQNLDSSNSFITKIFDKEGRNKLVLATFSIVLFSVLFWIFNSRI